MAGTNTPSAKKLRQFCPARCKKNSPPTGARSSPMPASTTPYPILNPANPLAARASLCALAVMAKAPRAGKVKTRLAPPLTLDQSAAINICFLQDTSENIAAVATSGTAAGIISYTPIGHDALFDTLLPADFSLIPQRGDGFGDRLPAPAAPLLTSAYRTPSL